MSPPPPWLGAPPDDADHGSADGAERGGQHARRRDLHGRPRRAGQHRRHERDEAHQHHRDDRDGDVAQLDRSAFDRHRVAERRMVDLLRQRFDGVQGGEVQRQARDGDEGRRAVPRATRREAGDGTEQHEPSDARRRPAQQPANAARPHRQPMRAPGAHGQPRPQARQLHRQLPPQHDDRAHVLQRRREAHLTDERGSPLRPLRPTRCRRATARRRPARPRPRWRRHRSARSRAATTRCARPRRSAILRPRWRRRPRPTSRARARAARPATTASAGPMRTVRRRSPARSSSTRTARRRPPTRCLPRASGARRGRPPPLQ